MDRLTFKKWFEHYKPDEETTTICVDGYVQIVETQESNYGDLIAKHQKQHHYLVGDAIDRLAEYENAEEQGLLWKLPCKVGDYVYQINRINGKITTHKVAKIVLDIMGGKDFAMQIFFETAGFCFSSHFGKIIFLDKIDAIKALEEYSSRKSK